MRIPRKSPTKSGNQGEEPEKVKLFLTLGLIFFSAKQNPLTKANQWYFVSKLLEATGLVFVLIILSLFVFFKERLPR